MKKIVLFFVVLCSMALTSCEQNGPSKGHKYVDLGLSVKWATCNAGAETPEGYGDYFAWGEVKSKSGGIYAYWYTNYKWFVGKDYVKYNNEDKKVELELEDDAANVNWGGRWRMPTREEFQELVDKCIWTWDDVKKGYLIIGSNGNSIFLPAGGAGSVSDDYGYPGEVGNYWTSTLDSEYGSYYAFMCMFGSDGIEGVFGIDRYEGFSVRPVLP